MRFAHHPRLSSERAWQPPSSQRASIQKRSQLCHKWSNMPKTFHTSSRYYNLPTPVYLYVRFSFPLRNRIAPRDSTLDSTLYYYDRVTIFRSYTHLCNAPIQSMSWWRKDRKVTEGGGEAYRAYLSPRRSAGTPRAWNCGNGRPWQPPACPRRPSTRQLGGRRLTWRSCQSERAGRCCRGGRGQYGPLATERAERVNVICMDAWMNGSMHTNMHVCLYNIMYEC